MELREELILAITKASVEKIGVDVNPTAVKLHAEGIVKLVDEILEQVKEK